MHNAKLRNKRFLLALFICAIYVGLQLHIPAAFAEKPQEEYSRIQKSLKSHRKKLESVKKVEQSVLGELRKTTAELGEIERQLAQERDKIKGIQRSIAALQEEVKADSAALQAQRGRLKKRLRALLMFNIEKDAVLILLSGEDVAQTLRIMRYLRDISAFDYGLIRRYKEDLRRLAEKETGLRRLYGELKGEEKKLAQLESSLKEKKKERETLLVSVRKEKGMYENMIRELKESSARLLSIIRESEKREKERRKKSGKSRPGAKEEADEDSEFLRMKGRLHWPVGGTVGIRYGSQVDPLFNLPVFRSGIHIRSESGATVKAVYGGRVVYADDFKGYGQLVIVSHGSGYHTLYGNLAKIFSKNGAIIRDNQAIGEVGESTALGASGLYFEIRYKGKPLDPQQWLGRQ